MCVEKLQKILLAMALGIVMMLIATGSIKAAFLLQFSIMIILIVSGLTGFCYITQVLKTAFPLCNEEKK
jgi:general stress protein CsbA